ncbi:TIGR04255 family protein [Comamonas odontotermitis]|uniref:TIGR04255 family protein n=1 Tax=Comamonas odontotermitis TaxID=379895 RepID=UPI0037517C6E
MGTKLANAPVYYTIAQVQFNHILDLDSFVSTIQSKMREVRFLDFKRQMVQRLEFPIMGLQNAQAVPPALTAQTRYMFGDIDGQTAFILDTNSLTLLTTAYDTFETFSKTFLNGLEIVSSSVRLDLVERIGIRYLDAVHPSENSESLRDYFIPEVLGLSQHGHGQLQHSFSETTVMTTAGQLISRVFIREGQVGLPNELGETPLSINPRFTKYNGLHAIIDTDASSVIRIAFDPNEVLHRLSALHEEIANSFNSIVTDHARTSWV